jgi:hypothetical protein
MPRYEYLCKACNKKFFPTSDSCRTRQKQHQVPEMRKFQRRAAMGCFLRYDQEKELEASALRHGAQFTTCSE